MNRLRAHAAHPFFDSTKTLHTLHRAKHQRREQQRHASLLGFAVRHRPIRYGIQFL